MSNINLVLGTILLTSISLISITTPQNNKWEVSRLTGPTFPEIKSVVAYSTITCSSYMDEETINRALNKYYGRIQFMAFGDCYKGDK